MVRRTAWQGAAALMLTIAAARAEDVAAPPDCSGRAGRYAAEKAQLWVTRRGTMAMGENPLRPLTRDEVMVLQVVVNGRIATAWGPDETNLRQGGAAKDVERDGAGPIRWEPDGKALPGIIRVVAEDGTVLAGPMRLAECGDAPAAKAMTPTARRPEARPKERGAQARPAPSAPPGLFVPQGAIP